jgi:hypothetical protein
LCRRVPEPDGAVKPLHRQIGQLLGQLQLDVHRRVLRLKVRQRWPQPEAAKTEGGGEADR